MEETVLKFKDENDNNVKVTIMNVSEQSDIVTDLPEGAISLPFLVNGEFKTIDLNSLILRIETDVINALSQSSQ